MKELKRNTNATGDSSDRLVRWNRAGKHRGSSGVV